MIGRNLKLLSTSTINLGDSETDKSAFCLVVAKFYDRRYNKCYIVCGSITKKLKCLFKQEGLWSKASRPLANRRMGYKWTSLNKHVGGFPSEQVWKGLGMGGPHVGREAWAGDTQVGNEAGPVGEGGCPQVNKFQQVYSDHMGPPTERHDWKHYLPANYVCGQ